MKYRRCQGKHEGERGIEETEDETRFCEKSYRIETLETKFWNDVDFISSTLNVMSDERERVKAKTRDHFERFEDKRAK